MNGVNLPVVTTALNAWCRAISAPSSPTSERDRLMNLPVSIATANLIIALTEPHVERAMSEGRVNEAMALQSIISTINLALETGAPIEFK